MKKLALSLCLILFLGTKLFAQSQPLAFYKRCLVTSITGGPSSALYTTKTNDGKAAHSDQLRGSIDPIITEYGLTDRIGIGTSKGGETYMVNANKFYNANVKESSETMWSTTKYLTLDLSYHPYVTKRLDVSLFTGIGYYRVSGSCYNQDVENYCYQPALYSYYGQGAVVRAGVRTRFYITKRFGVMGLLYAFNGYAKEKQKPNTARDEVNTTGYSTNLRGIGAEFGICYRLFKQKGVVKKTANIKKGEEIKLAREEKVNEIKRRREEKRMAKEEKEAESDKVPLIRVVWD